MGGASTGIFWMERRHERLPRSARLASRRTCALASARAAAVVLGDFREYRGVSRWVSRVVFRAAGLAPLRACEAASSPARNAAGRIWRKVPFRRMMQCG
jgi:hypothetical protein